jgi:hypothetical protein
VQYNSKKIGDMAGASGENVEHPFLAKGAEDLGQAPGS